MGIYKGLRVICVQLFGDFRGSWGLFSPWHYNKTPNIRITICVWYFTQLTRLQKQPRYMQNVINQLQKRKKKTYLSIYNFQKFKIVTIQNLFSTNIWLLLITKEDIIQNRLYWLTIIRTNLWTDSYVYMKIFEPVKYFSWNVFTATAQNIYYVILPFLL